MKINIHIGVHKTATTYIQDRLFANLYRLNKSGIGFIPTLKFRSSFWERFMKLEPEAFVLEDHLDDFFPHGKPDKIRGLLISEENLIGLCGKFVKSGKPFNGVRPRLMHFRKLFAGHEITLFCAVRSYDSFLSSVYCEGIRTGKNFVSFDVFRERLDWEVMNWRVLVKRFEQGLTPDHTVLWKYEDFPALAEDIFTKMAFGKSLQPQVKPATEPTHQSFSQTAIDAIASVAERLGPEIAERLILPIGGSLPKSEGFAPFNPWSPDEMQSLQEKYLKHCEQIDVEKWLLPASESAGSRKVA